MHEPMLDLRGMRPENDGEDGTSSAEAAAFRSVLYHCSLILVLPLVVFFATKFFALEKIILGTVDEDSVAGNVLAAAVAVAVLHVALGLFIYRAYFSSAPPAKGRLGKQE